ncbi:MAG TPA: glucokinase [Xanthobacteraceae bacterium]|nr:glucokinase [Xanthobacteraceae bacterium]
MRNILLADVGATNTRIAMTGPGGRPTGMKKWRGDDVPSLEAAIARYIEETGARPEGGVLAIAAPVEGDEIAMTNRPWRFRASELAKRFGWRAVRAINDFEAVAFSLPHLRPEDIRPLGPPMPQATGPRVVFGAGTGLGVAALLPHAGGDVAVPTEGGHASFGPAAAEEEPIFARVRGELGYVSAEAVLSGPGLERLHRALHGPDAALPAAAITHGAHAGDAAARETASLFVRLFARFAGDLALLYRATGGVYAGGGVSRRLGDFLSAPAFRAAFENHPPFVALLRTIPTTLITLDEPGLLGCAAVAETL